VSRNLPMGAPWFEVAMHLFVRGLHATPARHHPWLHSFNWTYPVAPRQCSTFTVDVNGTEVVLPLKVLIVPVGPPPSSHEVRKVMEVAFPTNSMNVGFQISAAMSKFLGLISSHLFNFFDHFLVIFSFS